MSTRFGGSSRDPRNAARRAPSKKVRRVRVPVLRRSAAAITLLVAGVLLLTSSFTAWWTLEFASQGAVGFYPGDYLGGGITYGKARGGAETYQKAGLGSVAALYEIVLGLVLFMTVLAVAAGVAALGAERGLLRGRARGSGVGFLGLFVFLLALSTVVAVGAGQPGQLSHATFFSICTVLGNSSNSPCHAFYGSTSVSGLPLTWGPGYGFYATIFGGILALGAAIAWWSAREEIWEEEVAVDATGARPKFSTARPIPLGSAGRELGNGSDRPERASGGTYSTRRAYASARYAATVQGRPDRAGARPSGPPATGPTAAPAAPAPEPPGEPPVDLSASSEVEVIAQLKAKLDAGLLSPDEYAHWKGRLLAIPPEAFPAIGGSGALPHDSLHELDQLRDSGAISGPEYLQLRRRLLLRA
jgi:hypothetical protein